MTAVLVVVVCTPVAFARKWTDSTGKHEVEAEFAGLKDGKVQLRKPDGSVVTVPVEKLSQADQTWITEQSAAWVTVVDTSGKQEGLKEGTFSGFCVDCADFDLEVAPDSIVQLEVTGDASKVGDQAWYPVKCKTAGGRELTGRIDYRMTYTLGGAWENIVKSKTLKRLAFNQQAAPPKRPQTPLTADVILLSGASLHMTNVSLAYEQYWDMPLKFDWKRYEKEVSAERRVVVFSKNEFASAHAGFFESRVFLSTIRSVKRVDIAGMASQVPWTGPADKRPKTIAEVGPNRLQMWISEPIVGLGSHGWTGLRPSDHVRSLTFSGMPADRVVLKEDMLVGPPAVVEDRSGVKLNARHLCQTWREFGKEEVLPLGGVRREVVTKRDAMVQLSIAAEKEKIKVPFSEIAALTISGDNDPLAVELSKRDGKVLHGTFAPHTGAWEERDLQLVTDFGHALIAWADVRKVTFPPEQNSTAQTGDGNQHLTSEPAEPAGNHVPNASSVALDQSRQTTSTEGQLASRPGGTMKISAIAYCTIALFMGVRIACMLRSKAAMRGDSQRSTKGKLGLIACSIYGALLWPITIFIFKPRALFGIGRREAAEAHLDGPAQSSETSQKEVSGICDVCNQPTSTGHGGKVFRNKEMKRATERGFNGLAVGPNARMLAMVGISGNDAYAEWKRKVTCDTTDWLLCPECQKEIRRYT
jgi:hypothetical protein